MIDVIIPTRNAPSVLSMMLAHYWANAHDDRLVSSVTLLDNCSAAEGMEDVFADALRRGAKVIRHERNIGVWASVNRGVVLSRADKMLVLTSDILLAPDALSWLDAVQDDSGCAFLGPVVVSDQIEYAWKLYEHPLPAERVNTAHYNGACWLMTRQCIDKVGYFDPRFYICFGDVDYTQRVVDAGLAYGVTDAVRCLHLDKCSRRADHTASQDTEVEIRDWSCFAEKWQARSDVMEKHPCPNRIVYNMLKERYWNNSIQETMEVSA
jgi:GT2 family glycosyltransferase